MRILDVLNAPHLRFLAEDQMSLFPSMGTMQPVRAPAPAPVARPPARPARPKSVYDPGLYLPGSLGQHVGENALTVNDILHPDTPGIRHTRANNNRVIAHKLNMRARAALSNLGVPNGIIEQPSPKTDEIISRAIASEVKTALSRDERSGVNWYTKDFQQALSIAATLHPEIAQDENARMIFTAALAVTSNGEKVIRNAQLADKVYTQFKATGQFPTNIEDSPQKKSMNYCFVRLNELIARYGIPGTREFLGSKFTKKELADMGYQINGENKDAELHGSAILGPKIGQGFYQNLNGNYNPVTMDMWFMRAWGRLTGTLVGKLQPKVLAQQKNNFIDVLQQAGIKVPKNDKALAALADKIFSQHEHDFAKYRNEYNVGVRTKEAVVYRADRYLQGLAGINQSPTSGSHRAWMRQRVDRAREILAQEGINITNADLQATWWYPEKKLYEKLGGRDSEGVNVDYATAFKLLAQRQGVDDGTIKNTLGAVE